MKPLSLFVFFLITSCLGGRNIVFFATADIEYARKTEKKNHYLACAMQAFSLHTPWPEDSPYYPMDLNFFLDPAGDYPSGTMPAPLGVIFAGGLTAHGKAQEAAGGYNEFGQFEADFGLTGQEDHAYLKIPVYEGLGEIDYREKQVYFKQRDRFALQLPIVERLNERNRKRPGVVNTSPGGHYSWDWEDVHFVQLNVKASNRWQYHPDEPHEKDSTQGALSFLESDLARCVGASCRPVILIQHYGLCDDLEDDPLWTQAERDALFDVIKPYTILAIVHGHDPGQGAYTWRGIDVFNVTSQPNGRLEPASAGGYFTVFHLTDTDFEAYDVSYGPGHEGAIRPQWASGGVGLHWRKQLR